jgi:hypothetical protein
MSRKPPDDDVVYGNLSRMSEENGTPNATTMWLQRHGRVPITRIGPLWATNRRALQLAREDACRRGEKWAIEAVRKLAANTVAREDERECEVA